MNQLIKFGLILGVICLAATLVLAVTYEITKPKIEQQMKMEIEAALKTIIPEADSFTEKKVDDIDYFEATKNAILAGYCIKAVGTGYSGYMRIVVGIDTAGTIKGVKVLEHQETPGLGSKINEIRRGEKDAWFLRQFIGRQGKAVAIKKDIDAITGATISSKAVTDAIRDTVLEFLQKVKR
ncbi:MAG: RnfABCDGE type electron transport complex subunit G [Candidatus Omnitrophota bacterium]|nr:RnfABCDGE type electron transport complex subunit G [Candidatus Omnitrophota bacterium]